MSLSSRSFEGFRRALVAVPCAAGAVLAAAPVVLLGTPFWLVAWMTRRFHGLLCRFQAQAIPWRDLVDFEPVVGWRSRPHLDVRASSLDVFHLTTDGEGWRDREISLEAADLVVIGDSLAFGTGVDDRDFYGRNSRVRIKAVAGPAYSMVHGLLWMERLGRRLRGKTVVWFVYYGNDLYENLLPNIGAYRMPFVRERRGSGAGGSWEIVTSHVRAEPWPLDAPRENVKRLAQLCTGGHLAGRVFAACRYLIERAARSCRAAGARLVVVGIPDPTQLTPAGVKKLNRLLPSPAVVDPDFPDRAVSTICKEVGVSFVAFRRHLTQADYIEDDCHWNPGGHKRVAAVLEDIHRACQGSEAGLGLPGLRAGRLSGGTERLGRLGLNPRFTARSSI